MLNAAPPPCHDLKTDKHRCRCSYTRQPVYYNIYVILSLVSKEAFRNGKLVVIVNVSSLGTNYWLFSSTAHLSAVISGVRSSQLGSL